jgi:hypothetical protein
MKKQVIGVDRLPRTRNEFLSWAEENNACEAGCEFIASFTKTSHPRGIWRWQGAEKYTWWVVCSMPLLRKRLAVVVRRMADSGVFSAEQSGRALNTLSFTSCIHAEINALESLVGSGSSEEDEILRKLWR